MDSSQLVKKILILSANPKDTDQLRLHEEAKVIRLELKLGDKSYASLEERGATTATDLRREILDLQPYIVHFSGHGNSQGLMLEGKDGNSKAVPPDTLANLFKVFAKEFEIYCVVLNVCSSENQARAIAAHIDYVIGMRTSITDAAAIKFSEGFYSGLAKGKAITFSYELGCNSIEFEKPIEKSTPILIRKLDCDLNELERKIELDPKNGSLWRQKASIQRDLDKNEESIKSYEIALTLEPDNYKTLSQQGAVLAKDEMYEEALDSYNRATALEDRDYKVWRKKGLTQVKLGQLTEASASYERAIALEPPVPDIYIILTEQSSILQALHEFQKSIELCQQALKTKPAYRAAKYEQRRAYAKRFKERIKNST